MCVCVSVYVCLYVCVSVYVCLCVQSRKSSAYYYKILMKILFGYWYYWMHHTVSMQSIFIMSYLCSSNCLYSISILKFMLQISKIILWKCILRSQVQKSVDLWYEYKLIISESIKVMSARYKLVKQTYLW